MPAEGERATAGAPQLTVVIVADARDGIEATVRCVPDDPALEVLVTRPWPCLDGDEGPAPWPTVWAPGQGLTAAANAGIAAAAAPAVLLLVAGDRPDPTLAAAHLEQLAEGAAAVVGPLRPDPLAAWVGPVPPWGPHLTRHATVRVDAVRAAGGLDDRLHALEIAVPELLARLQAAGGHVRTAALPVLDARAADAEVLRAAGRSAQVLAVRTGGTGRRLGARHAAVVLRWTTGALRVLPGRDARLLRAGQRAHFATGRGQPGLPDTALDRIGLPPAPAADRPAVCVVVPFAGDRTEADALLAALVALERRPGDEVVVVDNSRTPTVPADRAGIRVVRADGEWSSYHARNVGWRATEAPWLLFVDADCRPFPGILDRCFSPPPGDGTGAVLGAVLPTRRRATFVERYSADAGVLAQARSLQHAYRPYGVTADLLVRRAALEELGGFCEGARSGADAELSWRLQEAGWALEHRWAAAVEHRHRSSLRGLLRQYRRYGAGVAWQERRWSGSSSGWLRPRLRPWRAAAIDVAAGRFALGATGVMSAVCQLAAAMGAARSNRPARPASGGPTGPTGLAGTWPGAEPVPAPGAVEAHARGLRLRGDVEAWYREDDALEDVAAGLWWVAARPGGITRVARAGLRGPGALRGLASDAAVARRVAARGVPLVALDARGEEDLAGVAALSGLEPEPGLRG